MPIATGMLRFDDVEELDFVGPWEVFTIAQQVGDTVVTIAEHPDPVRCAKGLRVLPDHTFDDAPTLDVLVVSGGAGTRREWATRCSSTGSLRSRRAARGSRASAPGPSCCTRRDPLEAGA